jgi:pimeloyl-ACP methyl ester carboxylesterase
MPTYEHDGLALAYTVVGEGPPILFVHGATGTGVFEWGDLAGRLATGHRCVMPDLRGHGASDFRRSGYSARAICDDLLQLVDHLDLEHPHVVGFSYGAEVALMLEAERPGTARSLVLVSPGTGRSANYRMPSIEHLHRIWPRQLRHLHDDHHGPGHWRSLVALLQADAADRPEMADDVLRSVRCPVLALAGDHDDPTRRRQGRRFADANPRTHYVEIVGAAHAVHLERATEVAQVVGDFLAKVDAAMGAVRPHGTSGAGSP